MTASIPASQFANVIPGVLSAGGNPLSLNSVYLTSNASVPVGVAKAFASYASVAAYFGADSPEATLAEVYFGGYTNCTSLPGTLYFVQYNTAAVGGYVLGASVAGLTLAELQALSDTGFTINIDGVTQTAAAINLSSASSFSQAATAITTALQSSTAVFSGTGSQTGGVVTISATASGQLYVGAVLAGAVEAGSTITSFGTYTVESGTGTVNVSTTGTVASGAISVAGTGTCTYNAQLAAFQISSPSTGVNSSVGFPSTDSLTTGLNLTAATGAVISAGAAAQTPASIMNTVVGLTQNFATFMTVTEQTLSNKEAFAIWNVGQKNRYLYVCQDTDVTALTTNATGSFGAIAKAAGYSGTMVIYDTTGGEIAAFATSITASLNFAQQDGATDFEFRNQAGLAAQITNQTVYQNLIGNGYSCYSSIATANQQSTFLANGQIAGPFAWADTYVEQIALNASFQLALIELLTNTPAVPYVPRGYNLIRSALSTPIAAAISFGSIVPGVTLSGAQAATLIAQTGDANAAATLQNTGWYLQILDPGSVVRGQRGSPVINFWYTDGGKIQQINMSSVDVQ